MSRPVLADTGPLYALSIRSDQYHARAREAMLVLEQSRTPLVVPYPLLMETYTLLLRRVTPPAAHRWLEDITSQVSLIAPTPEDYEAASRRVTQYRDQSITLFDALLAVLSEELDLPIWTFDHHFDLLHVEVWR